MRLPGHRADEIQVDSKEEHTIRKTDAQRALFKRYITPREKFGKEKVRPNVLFSILTLMSIALTLRNSRTDLRKKP